MKIIYGKDSITHSIYFIVHNMVISKYKIKYLRIRFIMIYNKTLLLVLIKIFLILFCFKHIINEKIIKKYKIKYNFEINTKSSSEAVIFINL